MGSITRKPIRVGVGALLAPAAALLLFAAPAAQAQPVTSGHATTSNVQVAKLHASSVSPNALTRFCRYTSSQPYLRSGSRGTAVKQAQCEINTTIRSAGLVDDGIFGPKTLAAVKRVQRCAHISADGVIGPDTWSVLNHYSNSLSWLC